MALVKRKLPSIKPNQLGLMMVPSNERIVIVLKKPNDTIALKDVTVDFALMLAAEIKQDGDDAYGIEREFRAVDTFGNALTLSVTAKIVSEEKLLDRGRFEAKTESAINFKSQSHGGQRDQPEPDPPAEAPPAGRSPE